MNYDSLKSVKFMFLLTIFGDKLWINTSIRQIFHIIFVSQSTELIKWKLNFHRELRI